MLALGAGGCSRAAKPAVERLALLPFENLTGDPQLDWLEAAMPKIIGAQLNGAPGTLPLLAQTQRDALTLDAHRYLHGYFDRRGGELHFEASIEDAEAHRMTAAPPSQGDVLAAAGAVAKVLNSRAQPFPTSNADALAAWGHQDFERAVQLDPDFGTAWLAWVQSALAAKDQTRAIALSDQALARTSLRSAVDRAQLEMTVATLRSDFPARSNAIAALAKLVPNDVTLLLSLANAELNSRRYAAAAPLFERVLEMDPNNRTGLNLLGYSYALSGRMGRAKQIFDRYAQIPTDRANAFDSLGEAYFMNGDFANAEQQFLNAHRTSPQLLAGADLAKAAYAHWLAGDLKGADKLYDQYAEFRGKLPDPLLVWRQAQWHYATGRAAEARQILETANGPAAALIKPQLEIWDNPAAIVPRDPQQLKLALDAATTSTEGFSRVFYADALLKTGRREEARELLRFWPLPESPDQPLLQSLVFPKYLELRAQLR